MLKTVVGSAEGSRAETASRAAENPSAMAMPWSASPITPSSAQSLSDFAMCGNNPCRRNCYLSLQNTLRDRAIERMGERADGD